MLRITNSPIAKKSILINESNTIGGVDNDNSEVDKTIIEVNIVGKVNT